jgi:hypothetical protein
MTEADRFHSMDELLADIQREWTALMDVAGRLSPEQMSAPDSGGWTAKDNLAHLTEWINALMGHHMDKRPSHEVLGVSAEVTKDWDMQVINPVLFERNRKKSPDQVLAELEQMYDRLVARLQSMTFEEIMQPRHADDPEKRPLLLWILGDTSEHFSEHRATIAKML